MNSQSNAPLRQLATELRQPAATRRMIFAGTQAERSQLANALAEQLGMRVQRVTVQDLGTISGTNEKGVILLFDEAEALFGKRADVKDAHDRYANLEASFEGWIILGVDHAAGLPAVIVERYKTVDVHRFWPPR